MAQPADPDAEPAGPEAERARMRAYALREARLIDLLESVETLDPAEERAIDLIVAIDRLREEGAELPAILEDPASPIGAELALLRRGAARDPVAWRSLAGIAALMLRNREDLPGPVRDVAIAVLEGRLPCPALRGRPPRRPLRDEAIAHLVADLAEGFGLAPTRNDASAHRSSACDIAAEALRALGRSPASYAAVKRIWLRHGRDLR